MRKFRSASDPKVKPLTISAPIHVVSSTSNYVPTSLMDQHQEDLEVFEPTQAAASCRTLPSNLRYSNPFPDQICDEEPETYAESSEMNLNIDQFTAAPETKPENTVKPESKTKSGSSVEPNDSVIVIKTGSPAEPVDPATKPGNSAKQTTVLDPCPETNISSSPDAAPVSTVIPESSSSVVSHHDSDCPEEANFAPIPEMTVVDRSLPHPMPRCASADPGPQSSFHCCPNCKEPTKRSSSAGSRITPCAKTGIDGPKTESLSVEERLDNLTKQMKELSKENRELKLEITKIYSILCQKTDRGIGGAGSGGSGGCSSSTMVKQLLVSFSLHFTLYFVVYFKF